MGRLFQSSPLRLTFVLIALFSVVSIASFAVSFVVARSTIEATIHDGLVQDVAGFMAAPSASAVATLVEAQGRVMDPSDRVIGYRDQTGRLFGNGAIVRTEAGFEVVALDQSDEVAEVYFILTQPIHGGFLTLAASADARDALRQTMTIVFLVSLFPTILIGMTGGIILSRRSAVRLNAIEGTLAELTSGNLSARVSQMKGGADDLSQIGMRIDKMAKAHEENVAVLRQVSADIAHDLKTPIQRVSVLLERARDASADKVDEILEQAREETHSMGRIFQALLQIANIEGGGTATSFEPVDLGELVENVSDLYLPSAEEQDKQINVQVSAPSTVLGDRTLLGQLLANLIENAIRHSGTGNQISVGVHGSALSVCDNGPGIPEAEREAVLRRLYRREASRSSPGSGLGLSLVKAVADLHNAQLSLEDNSPGLKVVLTLS